MTFLMFTAGLVLLTVGADFLVKGSSRLARRFGVPSIVVGLTIVAYGTSTPELVVSADAALTGRADLGLGNVVGSNIFNVLFILGLCACLAPLVVHRNMIWREVPFMIGISFLLMGLAADGLLARWEGILLLVLLAAYAFWQVRLGLKAGADEGATEQAPASAGVSILGILAGLGLLVLGAQWLLESAVKMARGMGVSELVIGLTVVAAGTSLPEVATSLLATRRGERDIAVGNVVGSNIFNILGVLGVASVLAPNGVAVAPSAWAFDFPVMLAATVACLPIFLTGHMISRWEGPLFLGSYIAYTAYLIMAAQNHDALPLFSGVMWGFVFPLTAATLGVQVYRHCKAKA